MEDASLLDMPLSVVSGVIAKKKSEMFKNSLRVAGQVKLSSGITEDLGAMWVTVNYMQSSKPPLSLMSAQKCTESFIAWVLKVKVIHIVHM